MAWTVGRDRWGEGIASEGATAAVEFAFTEAGRSRPILIIHPENISFIRVAEQLWSHPRRGTHRPNGEPRNIYAISRAEWVSRTTSTIGT
ncbi:GNAT family N-acetyltransferase [Frankia sp. ACN1ag]|uniref:GNAT family N-acetyltransferase n=1 Tax=Frankia sp. ACN1ag TaxID=102891 RepID=UPI000A8AEBB6|nr:GNAT family N-acetyltransferase [Frankia sp. ACN1ag]